MRSLRIGHSPNPQLGVHGSDFDLDGAGTSPSTVTLNSSANSSSLLVVTFGEFANYSAPTDNKGNTLTLVENSGYDANKWPGFGLELYAKAGAAGGSGHVVSLTKTGSAGAETTLIVLEATGSRTLQDTSVITRAAAGAGVSYTSASVVATGPALLVAIWGGDGGGDLSDQTATPENGWTVAESLFLGNTAYIQACVATKVVAAGTHTCAWTPTQNQGAILAMAAFQR